MSDTPDIGGIELHAYIDGALDPARREQVEARIARDPEFARLVAAYRADKALLKQAYGPLSQQPLPPEWLARLRYTPEPRTVSWRLVGSIAAALVVALVGVGVYRTMQPAKPAGFVEAALEARATPGDAQQVIDIEPGTGSHKYDAALSDVVKLPVKVPSMTKLGYRLVGLHFYRSAGAAEILYRDGGNRLFTLYLRRSDGASRFDQFERNGLRICIWQDEELGAVMAGNVSTAAMQRLASLAYTGLTL